MNIHGDCRRAVRLGGDGWPGRAGRVADVTDPHKWVIHGERLVDDTPHIRVSLADVELPNHVRFTQYVFRMRRCAMTVVLHDAGERVLMMRRHRFIVDRWVWEPPGGYVQEPATGPHVPQQSGFTDTEDGDIRRRGSDWPPDRPRELGIGGRVRFGGPLLRGPGRVPVMLAAGAAAPSGQADAGELAGDLPYVRELDGDGKAK